MNTDNDYIGLFNENANFSVDDDTIKINNDNNIYVDKITNDKIKFLLPYRLLGSNNFNNPIETKLTDDYINDNTINQSKILNLISDLSTINNNFSLYYTKVQSDNLYYNKSYIDNLIALYYTKVQSDNKFALITDVSTLQGYFTSNKLKLTNLTGGSGYGVLLNNSSNILSYGLIDDNYINTISQSKITNLSTNLSTINSNISTLQGYFTSNQLNLTNLNSGNFGSGNNYLVLCSVPNISSQIVQWQQIGDNFIAGGIQQSKILNLVTDLSNKVNTTTLTTNYSTTTTNDSRYLRTGQNIDISTYNFTTSGTINATTGNLKCNNLSSHNSTNIAIGSGLDLQNTYKIINSPNPSASGDLINKSYGDSTYLTNTQYNTDNTNYTYDYAYNNWRDSTTGLNRISSLVPPSGSNGTYYLQCIKGSTINTYSWNLTSSLSFSPFNTFQESSATNFMKLEQLYSPVGQTVPISIEYIASNSYNASYVASIGFNSSGYYGAINYSNPYGYIYSGARLRLMCINNSSAVDTAILCEANTITMYRNLLLNASSSLTCGPISSTTINTNNNNISMGSGSLILTGSISSGSINSNNNNINFGTASCFGNNYVNASGGASYHPQGWTANNNSSMNNFRITSLGNGTSGTDAINLNQLNSKTISTNYITTSTSGIADGVRICRGPGGTGDISIYQDNGTSTLLFNGWGRCGWRSVHATQTYQNRLVISNDRFAVIHGNDTTSGQNAGGYLSEWWYYSTIRAYISNGGTFTNSDKNMKHSFRNKSDISNLNKKDYLNRILKLPIYSYAFNNCDDDHCNSEIYTGPLYQDVKEIFNNNCVGNRKYLENYKCKEDCGTCKRRKEYYGEEIKTISASEIGYYHILAFQEYVNKTDKIINDLNDKYNNLENKFNQLLNKLNLTI